MRTEIGERRSEVGKRMDPPSRPSTAVHAYGVVNYGVTPRGVPRVGGSGGSESRGRRDGDQRRSTTEDAEDTEGDPPSRPSTAVHAYGVVNYGVTED